MGVLNVTPDSFSDGGCFRELDAALRQAEAMHEAGASIIDVGGESTRPGATKVSLQEELDRVCPVVERIAASLDVVVSVDTSTPKVMSASIACGAGMINDVRAFTREGALEAVRSEDVALCLMHMQGEPDTMQQRPSYASVVDEVYDFIKLRSEACVVSGIAASRLLIDPGFGFGKRLEHNLLLLKELASFKRLGFPLLVGLSRKSMLGTILNKEVDQRLFGSVSAAVISVMNGANIVRVHDVQETRDALLVADAVRQVALV